MPKFCPECGKRISDELNYCPECGIHIDSIVKRDREDKKTPTNHSTIPNTNLKTDVNEKSIWDTILTVLAIIVVLWFGYVFLIQGSSNSTGSSTFSSNPIESSKIQNIHTVKKIVEDYHATHTYSKPDMFVCGDMASDVWNMVITKGINAKIQVGNVDKDVSKIQDATHAWVLAEVSPNEWIALECTAGYLVCPFSDTCPVNNPLYYSGWSFASPKDFKDYLEKSRHPCPDGSILGDDDKCHLACGLNSYCTGDSVCLNGECRGCHDGFIFGQDYKCHQECPVGSGKYCLNGVCHSNGKCYAW